MLYGINANLLRTWIAKSGQPNHGKARALPAKALASAAAFVVVQVIEPAAPTTALAPAALCLHVRLPSGLAVEVGRAPRWQVAAPFLHIILLMSV